MAASSIIMVRATALILLASGRLAVAQVPMPPPPPPGLPWPPISPPDWGNDGRLQLYAVMPTEECRWPENCTDMDEDGAWFQWGRQEYITDPECDRPGADCGNTCRKVGYRDDECEALGNYVVFVEHTEIGTCAPCINASESNNMTRGYYCDDGYLKPCRVGMYCYADLEAGVMVEGNCSDGYICLTGYAEPQACSALKTCSGGKVQLLLLHYIAAMFIILLMNLLACRLWCRKRRMLRQSEVMRTALTEGERKLGQGLVVTSPVRVEFRAVNMVLKASKASVLKDINGSFPEGSLVALMGPSGGGKTTFMNAMLDRAPYGHVSGTFTINGVNGGFERVPSQTGFVPQDDIVHANLSVYENLFYNAMLRLPRTLAKSKKVEHVLHVMRVLGIEHIRNNLVGDATKRGISGGQKKRVNIGVELAAMPAIIFMDEPTSGLDGAATIELARCLGQLRLSGLTIICVIHQPRLAVYEEFTHLLLLGRGGQQVYCGRGDLIEEYFTSLGFRLPNKENPADWLIDVVCGLAPRYNADGSVDTEFKAPADLFECWARDQKHKVFDPDFYYSSGFVIPELLQGVALNPIVPRDTLGRTKQTYYMCGRSFRQHDMSSLATTCLILFVQGAVFAWLSNSEEGYDYHFLVKYLTGFSTATPLYFLFIAAFTRPLFTAERLNYHREFKSGISSFGYFYAKNLYNLSLLPFLAMSFSIALYIFAPPVQWFSSYFFTAFFSAWYWSGAAMFVSIFVESELSGTLVLIFWPLFEIVFEGSELMFSSPSEAPLSWFTCGRWNTQALFAAELMALPPQVINMTTKPVEGLFTLEDQLQRRLMSTVAYDYNGPLSEEVDYLGGDYAVAILYLFLYGVFFRGLALLLLVMGKYSQGGGYLSQARYVIKRVLFTVFEVKDGDAANDADAAEQEMSVLANSGKGGGNGWDFEPSGLMLGYSGGPFGGGGGDRRSFKTGRNAAPGHAPPLMGDQYGQILAGSSVGVELAPMIDGNGNYGGNGYGVETHPHLAARTKQPPPKLRAGNSFDTHPQL